MPLELINILQNKPLTIERANYDIGSVVSVNETVEQNNNNILNNCR